MTTAFTYVMGGGTGNRPPLRGGSDHQMTRDDQPDRRWTAPAGTHGSSEPPPHQREPEVMSAYDEVEGRPMFIIAAVESDRAWIAISEDAEVDTANWR